MKLKELQKEKFDNYKKTFEEIKEKEEEIERLNKEIAAIRAKRADIMRDCYEEYEEKAEELREPDNYWFPVEKMGIYLTLMEASGADVNFDSIYDFFELYEDEEVTEYGAKQLLQKYCPHDIEYIEMDYFYDSVSCDIEAEGHSYSGEIELKDGEIKIDVQ